MRATEIDQFEAKYGYKPTELEDQLRRARGLREQGQPDREADAGAGRGGLLEEPQARATRKTSRPGASSGLTGDWANRPISLYGRNSASGTYGFFKEHTLKNGDYKNTVKEQPGSASVVQGVTEDRFGIGYSGIGYKTSGVKAVALAETDKGPFSDGAYADVQSGKYPLWRFLYIYVNKAPGQAARSAGRRVREAASTAGKARRSW